MKGAYCETYLPFNVLFGDGSEFWLLDRSRGAWGEPADDLTCMAINYLFFSLQRSGRLAPPFTDLWNAFWNTYLERTGDQEVLKVVAPFFAWRALVVASPVWYDVTAAVRTAVSGRIRPDAAFVCPGLSLERTPAEAFRNTSFCCLDPQAAPCASRASGAITSPIGNAW